jgi:hypothetical protein
MSKTPITITLRADEWEEIQRILEFAADEFANIGWETSDRQALKFAKMIYKTVSERK